MSDFIAISGIGRLHKSTAHGKNRKTDVTSYANEQIGVTIGIYTARNRLREANLLARMPTKKKLIHTYIIGHYSPLVRFIDLVSRPTYVMCLNFNLFNLI